MSTYYLLDMHVPTVANMATSTSRIVDTVKTDSPTAEFRCDGLTPIRIPEGVRVVNPTGLADLLSQKYLSLFSKYSGFLYLVTDDLLDPSAINVSSGPSFMRQSGYRGSIAGNIRTTLSALPITVTQCVLIYETFTWRYVDFRDGRFERYYVEEPETLRPAQISVNGGTNFQTTHSGQLVTFTVPEQGNQMILEFLSTNPSDLYQDGRLVHIGSWALIL